MQPSITAVSPEPLALVVFRLGGGRYAIPLTAARRIFQAVAVTRLPDAPAVVEGVVSVHGELTPVFDLRRRFGLPERDMRPEDHLVLADADGRMALLHVDAVEAVAAVEREALTDPEQVVHGSTSLSGVARLPDGLVLIHDLARFLTQAESERLDQAISAAAASAGA